MPTYMPRELKSPDLSGLANDNGKLTDRKIKTYTLEGHYGKDKLETELINCNSVTFKAALEGRYGTMAYTVANDIRRSGLRRIIVRGPKPPRKCNLTVDELRAMLDEIENGLE